MCKIVLETVKNDQYFLVCNLLFQIAKFCHPHVKPYVFPYSVEGSAQENVYRIFRFDGDCSIATVKVENGEATFIFKEGKSGEEFKGCVEKALPLIERKVADIISV